jgi:hypothetical protein
VKVVPAAGLIGGVLHRDDVSGFFRGRFSSLLSCECDLRCDHEEVKV